MDSVDIVDIKNRIKKIDNVRAFLSVDSNDKSFTRSIKDLSLIMALQHIDSFYLLKDLFFDEKDVILSQERYNESPYPFYELKVVTNKNEKLSIIFIQIDNLNEYLNNISSYTLIYDKDKVLFTEKNYDEKIVFEKDINEENFKDQVVSFFINIIEVAASLSRRDVVMANFQYDVSKSQTLELLRLYIYLKYEKKVVVGIFGQNLNMHLDKEYLEMFTQALSCGNLEEFWNSIFTMASLFRKIGLEIARKENYDYPKKEDVDSMNYLRFLYDNFGRNI